MPKQNVAMLLKMARQDLKDLRAENNGLRDARDRQHSIAVELRNQASERLMQDSLRPFRSVSIVVNDGNGRPLSHSVTMLNKGDDMSARVSPDGVITVAAARV